MTGIQTEKPSAISHLPSEATRQPDPNAPRAWVAIGRVDINGDRAKTPEQAATTIFAVCVNCAMSTKTIADRIDLMRDVAQTLGNELPPGSASLWVFPGGYFGLDAKLQPSDVEQIEREVRPVVCGFPSRSVITFGVDISLDTQEAWVIAGANATIQRITRAKTPLKKRIFSVGEHRAAVFVCGEFTGSRTSNNGPFFIDAGYPHYLDEPEQQLSECQILVDLAHRHIRGTTVAASPDQHKVHQTQMERFSRHGVAVLTHHHDGEEIHRRAKSGHQSNWIVFPNNDWLSEDDVVEIPSSAKDWQHQPELPRR